ncbi:hypothetical protein DZS_46910 [Dickeya ananatis]
MKRIVLACSAGMSTSLVVTKMEKEAAVRGMEYQIYAIPEQNLRDELQTYGNDIIAVLLGPQVRFKLAENKKTDRRVSHSYRRYRLGGLRHPERCKGTRSGAEFGKLSLIAVNASRCRTTHRFVFRLWT